MFEVAISFDQIDGYIIVPPPEFTNMTIAGKSTMWSDKKCISYWTWGVFQPVMLANSGMYIFYQFDESGSYRWRKTDFSSDLQLGVSKKNDTPKSSIKK